MAQNNTQGFNEATLASYLDNRDFANAANYLSTLTASSYENQRELNRRIKELSKQAELQTAYLSQLDQEGVEAYHFANGFNGSGTIPHTKYDDNGNVIPDTPNSFGDSYTSLVNGLKVNNTDSNFANKSIDSIRVEIDANYINAFANNLGIKDLKNNNLGIKYTTSKDGKHIVEIPTSNSNFVKVVKASKELDSFWNIIAEGAASGATTGAVTGAGIGAIASGIIGSIVGSIAPVAGTAAGGTAGALSGAGQGAVIGGGVGGVIGAIDAALGYKSPYEIKGVGKGFVAPTGAFNSDSLDDLVDLVDKANEKVKSDKERVGNVTVNEEMYVSPFLGHGHANAFKRYSNGAISIDEYNKIVEERTNTYNTLLKQTDLTQFKVFAGGKELDNDKNLVMKEIDNPDRLTLMKNLSVAIADKRVTYSAAIRGGEMGTYITIAADKDKNGDLSKGSTEQFTRIFVPGLFKSSCDESFNTNTKTIAARDNADMKRFNYGKRCHDGNYVGWCRDLGSYKIAKDENGQEIKVPISEEEIMSTLNREAIIDGTIDRALATLDRKGNTVDINSLIEVSAVVGTDELYPSKIYGREERLYQKDKLYRDIYSILNLYINNKKGE